MPKAETLAEVKRAEDEVRTAREQAARESAEVRKEARAKANEILAQADEDAEALYRAEIEKARAAVQQERATILATGAKDADAIRNAATGPRLKKAVEVVVERFQAAANAPK